MSGALLCHVVAIAHGVPDAGGRVRIDQHQRELIHGIDGDRAQHIILKNVRAMLGDLGIAPICEGVETRAELATIQVSGSA